MTQPLCLALSFPTGQFHAHDGRGDAEWPPAPARIVAMLLSTAYRRGSPREIAATRRLFELPPPTLWTPPVGSRQTDSRRWVPVDIVVNPDTGAPGRGGLNSKLAKPPERGVVIGDGRVLVRWPAALDSDDFAAVTDLLVDVTYLGRPTSPVIVQHLAGESWDDAVSSAGLTRWEPDERGRVVLRVATPRLLAALDQRELEREESGITGHHPPLTTYPMARYRKVRPFDPGSGQEVAVASPGELSAAIEVLNYYPTPRATPADVPAIMQATGAVEGNGRFLLPVVGASEYRGQVTERLFGVATYGIVPEPREYLHGRELVDLGLPRAAVAGATAISTVRAAWGSAAAWSTIAPVEDQRERLQEALTVLAQEADAQIRDATVHDACRHPHGADMSTHPGLTHVSVLFDRPVDGPLVIGGGVMLPFPIQVIPEPCSGS